MSFVNENLPRFKKHQKNAAVRALKRLAKHKAVYIAADPGLGKTLIAMILASKLGVRRDRFVYVCPGSLESNVEAEFLKWRFPFMPMIVSDSMLDSASFPASIELLVIDETHRYKNDKTKRTSAIIPLIKSSKHVVFMSGTPLPNSRPVELWTVMKHGAPDVFGTDFSRYAKAFCAPKKTRFGWDFSGRSNFGKFKEMLFKDFMIRIRKSECELPPITEGLIVVGKGLKPELQKLEQEILNYIHKNGGADILYEDLGENPHFSTYLKELGKVKIPLVLPILENMLQAGQKIIVFARHLDVLETLYSTLTNWKPALINGKTPQKVRKFEMDRFQNDPTCQLAILSIGAGNLGWNLTAADRVLFVETSWRDGDNQQGMDRAHRIGRIEKLIVQYAVVKNSLDAKRMGKVLAKRINSI